MQINVQEKKVRGSIIDDQSFGISSQRFDITVHNQSTKYIAPSKDLVGSEGKGKRRSGVSNQYIV